VGDGGAVAGVAPEERGVGAVERGDDLELVLAVKHFAGEHGGGGVRHGVVDVQDIERVRAADLGHLHRKRQRVVGIFEEVVAVDDDGMEEHARPDGQAEGGLVADEVDFVAAPGEFVAEFGGENAAAADRGVAGDGELERTVGHEEGGRNDEWRMTNGELRG